MANPKKLITFSNKSIEMIETLIEEKGYLSISQTVNRGIEELYKTYSKYGKELGDKSTADEDIEKQAERKVKFNQAKKEQEEKNKLAPKIKICEVDLGGEVVTNPDGSKICKWQTHDVNKSYDQAIALSQCGEYLIPNVFMPDKDTVLKVRKDLRAKFK